MWNFKIIERGIPERNPRETEFFKLTSPAEAVVREFIQNSLDARMNNEQTLTIKIAFHRVSRPGVTGFLDNNLKQHLVACRFLESGEYPEVIPCLILEDFGTTGLDGDFNPETRTGNFYNFWWREGISEKTERKAGRWGLGKTTFHIISKHRTFFGLTVRNNREMLLMGKALLKTHTLNNQRYHYFGYFSDSNSMPLKDNSVIAQFKSNFGISRNNEPGLSLAIPLPVDGIDFDSILKGIIQHYYYPILARTLKVELYEDDRQEALRDDNLIEKASTINWNDTEWEGINIREILEFIKAAITIEPVSLQIQDPDKPAITEGTFGDQLDAVKRSFRSGTPCKVKMPITITKVDRTPHETFFTIILKRFPGLRKAFEGYIRSGILISEIRILGSRPVAGILVAEDEPVCEFLGDCENPAHTNWNERTEGFEEKYRNAVRILRFIKKSLVQIVSILDEPPRERQVDFLKEIFSVPVNPEDRGGEQEETTRPPVIPPVKRRPGVFDISIIRNGFSVTLNSQITHLSFPFQVTVRMAYDTFRGDPFGQYEKFDFDVGSSPIIITTQDCNVLDRKLNKLEIEVTGRNFKLEVTGFDPNRDLVVDIKEKR